MNAVYRRMEIVSILVVSVMNCHLHVRLLDCKVRAKKDAFCKINEETVRKNLEEIKRNISLGKRFNFMGGHCVEYSGKAYLRKKIEYDPERLNLIII